MDQMLRIFNDSFDLSFGFYQLFNTHERRDVFADAVAAHRASFVGIVSAQNAARRELAVVNGLPSDSDAVRVARDERRVALQQVLNVPVPDLHEQIRKTAEKLLADEVGRIVAVQ